MLVGTLGRNWIALIQLLVALVLALNFLLFGLLLLKEGGDCLRAAGGVEGAQGEVGFGARQRSTGRWPHSKRW